MILDQTRAHLDLLLGVEVLDNMVHDLVRHGIDVGPILGCPHAIHKGHGKELVCRRVGNCNLPALIRRVSYNRVASKRLGILGQILALDLGVIPIDLDILAKSHGQIPHTALNEPGHVRINGLHSETSKVRSPVDADIGLVLGRLDRRLTNLGHVILEGLGIDEAACLVHNRHHHLLGKDVHQLDSVAVLTTDQLLLVLVVVGRCQELTKDHLRNPGLVLRMLGHGNRVAVILDREGRGRACNLNRLDCLGPDCMVVGIDQELINQLVEPGIDWNGVCNEPVILAKKHLLLCGLDTTNVCVREGKNVLTVGLLAVSG